MFKESNILENDVTTNKSPESIEIKPFPDKISDQEKDTQSNEQEITHLEESVSSTKTALNQAREKLGIPSSDIDSPSVAQVNEKIATLRSRSPEVREFTKHYSSFWRDQLAQKISDAREKFNQKKVVVQEENVKRDKNKAVLENEISTIKQEINKVQSDMESYRIKLEEEKSRIAYRIASLLGRERKVPVEGELMKSETELEMLRKELDKRRNLFRESEEVILDDSEMKEAKEEMRKFYDEQKGIYDTFEQEKTKERDVAHISQEKKVLFVHTLSLDKGFIGSTTENNPNLDTKNMTSIDKTKIVLGIEPTLSVSTISLSGEDAEKGFKTFYPIGLIIGEGTVLSAYGGDAGTYADNPFARRSKYDRTLKSNIQENISGNLQKALKREADNGVLRQDAAERWNEIVVDNPKVSGIFLDTKKLSGDLDHVINVMKQAFSMAQEFGLPVYDIRPDGKMVDLTSEDFREVTQENILSYQCTLDTDEKIEGVKKVLKTQEEPSPEIQRKLDEIAKQEKSNQTLVEVREKRAIYSSKAAERLQILKYEQAARNIVEWGKSFEEIYKGVENAPVDENFNPDRRKATLESLKLMFGGKTEEEIKTYARSVLQKAEILKNMVK